MSTHEVPAPLRAVRVIGESSLAVRIAAIQEAVYGPILSWARHSPLHTAALGHSLHPPLTDVTLGCWMSAALLDGAGGVPARPAATLLVGVGSGAALLTAVAGAADYTELSGEERHLAAVHAFGADLALVLLLGSWVARLKGHHGLGVGLSLTGNVVVLGAGFLGGHLALNRGVARRDDGPALRP